mmetsp:Transcript_101433/g.286140  ORF Transcript_101433/g.286140 Transcript_101433/m.286140 type:complete len:278 (+) Transcript_101433:104-937(+)
MSSAAQHVALGMHGMDLGEDTGHLRDVRAGLCIFGLGLDLRERLRPMLHGGAGWGGSAGVLRRRVGVRRCDADGLFVLMGQLHARKIDLGPPFSRNLAVDCRLHLLPHLGAPTLNGRGLGVVVGPPDCNEWRQTQRLVRHRDLRELGRGPVQVAHEANPLRGNHSDVDHVPPGPEGLHQLLLDLPHGVGRLAAIEHQVPHEERAPVGVERADTIHVGAVAPKALAAEDVAGNLASRRLFGRGYVVMVLALVSQAASPLREEDAEGGVATVDAGVRPP